MAFPSPQNRSCYARSPQTLLVSPKLSCTASNDFRHVFGRHTNIRGLILTFIFIVLVLWLCLWFFLCIWSNNFPKHSQSVNFSAWGNCLGVVPAVSLLLNPKRRRQDIFIRGDFVKSIPGICFCDRIRASRQRSFARYWNAINCYNNANSEHVLSIYVIAGVALSIRCAFVYWILQHLWGAGVIQAQKRNEAQNKQWRSHGHALLLRGYTASSSCLLGGDLCLKIQLVQNRGKNPTVRQHCLGWEERRSIEYTKLHALYSVSTGSSSSGSCALPE